MNIGWNFRREHLRIQQRSHYVITDGGDQPNVVPPTASVWYFFRETDYENIMRMWRIGDAIAEGAALMTGTTVSSRVLGAAWPQHHEPGGGRDDVRQHPARRDAGLVGRGPATWPAPSSGWSGWRNSGLVTERRPTSWIGAERVPDSQRRGGGSDDIGDVSWVVPTATLRFAVEHRRRGVATTGTRGSRWPPPSRTRGRRPAPRCRP